MKLLVDTNVLLEFLLRREKYDLVSNFFFLANIKANQTFITSMSMRDIGYIVHKYNHDNSKTKQIQILLYSMISKVVPISADNAIESLYSDISDYEDSLQSFAAEEAMCDAIITFNKKDFAGSRIPVFTPDEICKIWKE